MTSGLSLSQELCDNLYCFIGSWCNWCRLSFFIVYIISWQNYIGVINYAKFTILLVHYISRHICAIYASVCIYVYVSTYIIIYTLLHILRYARPDLLRFEQPIKCSRSQMFFKLGVLKNFAIFAGKHLFWRLCLTLF